MGLVAVISNRLICRAIIRYNINWNGTPTLVGSFGGLCLGQFVCFDYIRWFGSVDYQVLCCTLHHFPQ